MKVFYIAFYIIFQFLSLPSFCQNQEIVIQGKIDTIPNTRFFISFMKDERLVEDSITIDSDQQFKYTYRSNEPLDILISVPNEPNSPWYEADIVGRVPLYRFWSEPNKITLFHGKKNKGQLVKNSYLDYIDSIYNAIENKAITEAKISNNRSRGQIMGDIKKEFLINNNPNYYSLILLDQMIRKDSVSFVKNYLSRIPDSLANTPLAGRIKKRLEIKLATSVGNKFVEFVLEDTTGQSIGLKNFQGKYVLVDFWSSWCVPCRKEHPALIRAYEKYHKNLEIISISIDNEKLSWIQAIRQDSLTWTQLTNGSGVDRGLAERLYIKAIPRNFLIDRNGVIVATNLMGAQLETKLKELLD